MPSKRRQLRTLDYTQDARDRLAGAVTTARLAAGYKWRTTFAKAAKVSIRSVTALELGEAGVGQSTLFAVASVLPGWDGETPRLILEGGPIPSLVVRTESPVQRPLNEFEKDIIKIYRRLRAEGESKRDAMRIAIEIGHSLKQDESILVAVIDSEEARID